MILPREINGWHNSKALALATDYGSWGLEKVQNTLTFTSKLFSSHGEATKLFAEIDMLVCLSSPTSSNVAKSHDFNQAMGTLIV